MKSTLNKVFLFFVATGFLAICLAFIIWRGLAGSAFDSNILSLLPSTQEQNKTASLSLFEDDALQRQFIILLSDSDVDRARKAATSLRSQLAQAQWLAEDSRAQLLSELKQALHPYRFQLLSDTMRQQLQDRTTKELAQALTVELFNPVQSLRLFPFAEDPFNLGGAWLQQLFPLATRIQPGEVPAIEAEGRQWYILRGRLPASPFEPQLQQALQEKITAFQTAFPSVSLLTSGLVFHAGEATALAQKEISTVGLGSLLAIAALVWLVFRSLRATFAIAFTLSSAVIVALAACLLCFDHVHLITLAFGSTLLGQAVDYCFHFLLKYRHYQDAAVAGRAIRRGLMLSAGSSIAAYLIQLLSPFPGLHQIAVFIAVGLLAACLAVAVLALTFSDKARAPRGIQGDALFKANVVPFYQRLAKIKGSLLTVLLLLAAAGAWKITSQPANDDIRQLNSSSPGLLASEGQVRKILGALDTQRYWQVKADSLENALQASEGLIANLNLATPPHALALLTPSAHRQHQDYQLVFDKLYAEGAALDQACALLSTQCEALHQPFKPFASALTVEQLPASISEGFPELFSRREQAQCRNTIDRQGSNASTVTCTIWPGSSIPKQINLQTLDATLPQASISFVDQVETISSSLASFRGAVSILLLAFLLLCIAISLVVYRRRGLAVVLCLCLVIPLALVWPASHGIMLFHVLALLLVAGISVDTLIFYLELGFERDTWMASTLSTLTSALAFGLLSLSQVPLLHHFGSVVLCGLLCTWVLAPLLYAVHHSISEQKSAG